MASSLTQTGLPGGPRPPSIDEIADPWARYGTALPQPGIPVRRKELKLSLSFFSQVFVRLFSCCIPSDVQLDMKDDLLVVQRVHDEMIHITATDVTSDALAALYLNPKHTLYMEKDTMRIANHQRMAEVQPRFVAQVVVALRCKLGLGTKNRSVPGNVELVRREACKMMRKWNVRDHDASTHLRWVERCFFEEDAHDRLPEWRARAAQRSRLMRWLFKDTPPEYDY